MLQSSLLVLFGFIEVDKEPQALKDWVLENISTISALANVAMLFVWLFYARLFYAEFRRQRRVQLFIHQAQGYDLDSYCLVVNMSREPVHILCVLLAAEHYSRGVLVQQVTGYRRSFEPDASHITIENVINQGPLSSGEFFSLGTFRDILRLLEAHSAPPLSGTQEHLSEPWHELLSEVTALEIRVIAIHGARQAPVGAYRRFAVTVGEAAEIRPAMVMTRQMDSRRDRVEVSRWLDACLQSSTFSTLLDRSSDG